MTPYLSVVIPAYNEMARLSETLPIVLNYLRTRVRSSELIVVDDGSTDHTPDLVHDYTRRSGAIELRLIRYEKNRGKGYAVRTGVLAACAPYVLFSDADLSTPISELPKVVGPIASGKQDLVFGSRHVADGTIGIQQSWHRQLSGRIFNTVVRTLTGLPFRDTQCGFKAFRMSACRPILEAATIDRFGFDVELLMVAHRAGLRMLECPVRWNHCEGSKVNVLKDSLRMFSEVQRVRGQHIRGLYEQAAARAREAARNERDRLLSGRTLSFAQSLQM